MSNTIMPEGRQRYFNNDGTVAAGGRLYTYSAGTVVPKTTYSDAAGTQPNTNPIILDAKGEALVYWGGSYKVNLLASDLTQITGYPVDNITSPVTAEDLAVAGGAGLLGFIYATAYLPGTIGRWLKDLATSVGATFIGYIALGAGAVLRTLESKLRERISAADFGAVGDNVADDTAALNLFFDAIANKTGYLTPNANYKCLGTVTIKGDRTKLYGCGATINSYAGGSAVTFALVGGVRYCYNVNIEDLSINAYGVGSYAFRVLASYSTFRRISIGIPVINANGRGMALYGDETYGTGPYYNTFIGCDVQSSSLCLDHIGFSFISVAPSFNRAPNCNTFIGCRAGQCLQDWNIKGNGNVLINPIAEGVVGAGTGFTFEATTAVNCNQNHIFGGYIEGQLVGFNFSANSNSNMVVGMYGTGVTTWKTDAGSGNMVHTAIGAWAMPTGINFPTPSTDPNALDRYQESSATPFTPVATGFTVNSGAPVWTSIYTRVGDLVTFSFKMTGGNLSSVAGVSRITLPFAANASFNEWGVFGNPLVTAFGGGIAAYGSDLYFSSVLTSSQFAGTITYHV